VIFSFYLANMPIKKSAKKYMRVTAKNTLRNRSIKGVIKSTVKGTREAIAKADVAGAKEWYAKAQKALDKAAELYADSEAAFKDARKAAPVAMPGGILVNTQGGAPGMIGVAVMGRLHAMIGRPMAVHNIEARGQFSVFEREGLAGLADYAQPTANLLMSGQHGG